MYPASFDKVTDSCGIAVSAFGWDLAGVTFNPFHRPARSSIVSTLRAIRRLKRLPASCSVHVRHATVPQCRWQCHRRSQSRWSARWNIRSWSAS